MVRMTNNNFGGRYSTNYIEDIKPPTKHVAVQEDRSGLTNFRPFEEIAHNVPLARHIPRALHKKVWIDYSASSSPVDVQVLRHPAFDGYTYIPPLTTWDFNLHQTTTDYYEAVLQALRTFGATSLELFKRFGEWVGGHITLPIITAVSTVLALVFGTTYTVDQGVQRRWKTGIRAYALASVLALFVIIGSFLLLNHLLGQSAQPANRTATSSSHFIQQPASSSTSTASSSTASTPQSGAATPNTSASSGTVPGSAGTAGSNTSLSNSGTSGTTNSGSLPVGGYGGGGMSTPSTSSTSTTTNLLSNPANVIPYGTVTTPPLSVSSGDKQVLSTSPTTITTN